MKFFLNSLLALFFIACGGGGGGGGGSSSETKLTNSDRKIVTSSVKTTLLEDNFSRYQWHLNDLGSNLSSDGNDYYNRYGHSTVGGNDLGLNTIWTDSKYSYLGYNAGNPIIVQVVDDGVDSNHEDLKDNMHLSSSYNDYTNSYGNPTPNNTKDADHGTQVAGLISAVGYNNIGVKGVAPSSNLSAYTFESSGGSFSVSSSSLQRAWYTTGNDIAISNNSWGQCVNKDSVNEAFLELGAQGDSSNVALRNGKGRIYLFASGNGRTGEDSCPNTSAMESANTNYFQNSQYAISVAGVANNNQVTSYSTPGSNVLVSGYTGDLANSLVGMGTTIPTGNNQGTNFDGSVYGNNSTWSIDTKGNYTYTFQGTSAATPVVSGALALVLEACPKLTYRDVKNLIAKTATKVSDTYITNAAGLSHSNNTGFGLINIKGMIDGCKDSSFTLLGSKSTATGSNTVSETITNTTITKNITISQNIKIEWIGLTVSIDSDSLEDVQISLVSPNASNAESILLHENNALGTSATSYGNTVKGYFNTGFRLSTVAFMDETSNGTWQVKIKASNATLNKLDLEIVGH